LAARFFSCLLSYFASDAVPIPRVTGAGPLTLADTHFQVGAAPARLPTLRKVLGVLGERIDVDTERTLRTIAAAKRIVDQLQIGSTGFAESLGFQ